jgi:adenine/guanine phosphoribosyltransferase-like PRPP-binding protein
VLLLDDTWVSGASAQSAAAALRLAGASHVAAVILGRHVNPDDPASAPLLTGLAPARYDPLACAVHRPLR